MKKAIFPLFALSLLIFFTTYKVGQLWPETSTANALAISLLLFVAMFGWQLVYRRFPSTFDRTWLQILAWIGSTAIGLWGTFILLSLPLDLIHFALASTGTTNALGNYGFVILITSIGINMLGLWQTLMGPKIKQVNVVIPNLSPELEGLRITQISDLHVGPTIQSRYVKKVVHRVNESKPDIVVFTGDLADAKASNIKQHMKPLSEVQASYGKFYVTGNHEYYWGAKELINEMQSLGFAALINENRELDIKSARVLVAGVTDPAGAIFYPDHRPDLARALKTQTPASTFNLKLLLCHRPGVSLEAEPAGIDVQFSGHTHAGQFFPFNLLIPLAHRYYRGLNRHGRLWVYVNPGTGYWGPANRFAIPSEITSLTLTRTPVA